jgi:hypothetical protein
MNKPIATANPRRIKIGTKAQCEMYQRAEDVFSGAPIFVLRETETMLIARQVSKDNSRSVSGPVDFSPTVVISV